MAWDKGFEVAFNPKSVVIVGASGSTQSATRQGALGGTSFIRTLQRIGFPGRIYPVNPNVSEILGLKTYPSLASVPETIDLVIVSVRAPEVPGVLEECAQAGMKNIHIFSSGFKETGEREREELEEKIKEIAQRGGLRLLGPNCVGLNIPSARMSTLQAIDITDTDVGPVAFLSQSGGHCLQFTRYGRAFGIGFSKVISYGNAAGLDCTDFLEYLATDPETRIICLYVEGVKDGRKLFSLIKEINRTKPVIAWKGGLTASGARAAASHTGSLAGGEATWNAFLRQTGAVQVISLDELADVTMTFLYLAPPRGRRVALFLGGGGHSVTGADFCAREGVDVPILTEETRKELRSFVPIANTSIKNPVDIEVAWVESSIFERAMAVVAADPLIDFMVVDPHLDMLRSGGPDQIGKMGEFLRRFAREQSKPIAAVFETWGGNPEVSAERARLGAELPKAGVPVYRTLPRAFRAISKFIGYHEFQAQAA